MPFFVMYKDYFRTVTVGTVKVGANDSFQVGYEFSNAFTLYEKPWKKWVSSYSCNNEHDISLTWTGGFIDCLVILGANFSTVEIDSVEYTLTKSELGDYRLCHYYGGYESSPQTLKIKAEQTESGKFEMWGIIPCNRNHLGANANFPTEHELIEPVIENLKIRKVLGRRNRILKWNRKMLTLTYAKYLASHKFAIGMVEPFILWENRGDLGKVYLARRLDTGRRIEQNHQFEDDIIMEEIA